MLVDLPSNLCVKRCSDLECGLSIVVMLGRGEIRHHWVVYFHSNMLLEETISDMGYCANIEVLMNK